MAEVFVEFADVIVDDKGVRYHARACGAEMAGGTWQGWLEFAPLSGATPIRSDRETTQPNRTDTVYWATGLSPVYLDGALQRALKVPISRSPAPDGRASTSSAAGHSKPPAAEHEAVLDPFSVYEKGEWLLRNQLAALSAWHLVNIIEAYDLSDEPVSALNRLTAPRLIELIVSVVTSRAAR